MTSSEQSGVSTSELTKCQNCSSDLQSPKSLPCLHAFCLPCIRHYYKDDSPGKEVHCPVCRQMFLIPSGGIEQLASKFSTGDPTGIKSVAGESSNSVPRDSCAAQTVSRHSQVPNAALVCAHGQRNLCSSCIESHAQIPDDNYREVPTSCEEKHYVWRLRSSFCNEHIGNRLQNYCTTCQVNACVVCLDTDHQGHDLQSIDAMYKSQCDSLKRDIGKVADDERRISQEISRLQVAERQRFVEIELIEKRLLKNANELKQRIDEVVNELMQRLSYDKQVASGVTSRMKKHFEEMLVGLRSFRIFASELVDNGEPYEVTHAYKGLQSQAKKMVECDLVTANCDLPQVDATSGDIFNRMSEVISEMSQVDMIHSTGEGEVIWGMTSLGEELFVGYQRNDVIRVFDTESYTVQRTIQIPGLGAVNDMTSDAKLRCVYVADIDNKVIHRIGEGKIITQWPVNDEPRSLSVNTNNNVIVSCYRLNKVKEFTADGDLIRVLELKSDISDPFHTLQLTFNQFLISHGNVNDTMHRVCVVDSSSCVLQSFGGSRGSNNDQLYVPLRLAVNETGMIFVADFVNRRIVMLSPTLRFIRTVVSGLRGPCRIVSMSKLDDCMWRTTSGKITDGSVDN